MPADLAVVGGGLLGMLTAITFKLQEPDANVVLLEARTLGAGASTTNGGTIHSGAAYVLQDEPGMVDQCVRCRASWSLFGGRFDVSSQTIYLVSPDRSQDFVDGLTAAGIQHGPTPSDHLKALLRKEVQPLRDAWTVEEKQVDCHSLIKHLRKTCSLAGVDVRAQARVSSVRTVAGETVLDVNGRQVRTSRLAITAGAGTADLLRTIGPAFASERLVNRHGAHIVARLHQPIPAVRGTTRHDPVVLPLGGGKWSISSYWAIQAFDTPPGPAEVGQMVRDKLAVARSWLTASALNVESLVALQATKTELVNNGRECDPRSALITIDGNIVAGVPGKLETAIDTSLEVTAALGSKMTEAAHRSALQAISEQVLGQGHEHPHLGDSYPMSVTSALARKL